MYWLDQLVISKLDLEHETDFPPGTDVDVLFGPLKGLQGRVLQKNSDTKLVIWLDSIMQGVSVEIDPAYLSIANSSKLKHSRINYVPLASSDHLQAASSQ